LNDSTGKYENHPVKAKSGVGRFFRGKSKTEKKRRRKGGRKKENCEEQELKREKKRIHQKKGDPA